jgi:hypothetical protein
MITGSRPEITREMAATASQVYKYTSEKICKAIDFRFRTVEESIREICTFYLADKK